MDNASGEPMLGSGGWARKFEKRLALSDAFVIALVMVLAHGIRFGPDPLAAVAGPSAPSYWFVSLGIGAGWFLALGWNRSREARILGHGPQEYQRVIRAGWQVFATVAIIGFLTQWQISRGYLLMALPLGVIALLVYRHLWRMWIHSKRDAGKLQAQVLMVGPLRTAEQMIRRLHRAPRAGYRVTGLALPPGAAAHATTDVDGVPVIGALQDALEQARQVGAEYILLTGNDAMSLAESRRLGWALEGTGIGLIVAPAMVDVAGPRVSMSPVEGLPLLHVESPRFSGAKYWVKLSADKLAALVLLVVAALPMAVIAVLVKLSGPGPVIYRQSRVGQDYRPFDMLKFRSMHEGADQLRPDLTQTPGDSGNEVLFKLKDDPRVTPVGRVLRRFSLDELPQLWNVLRGDMSMVGPRPPLPSEIEHWDDRVGRRQLVPPGITGLWQVSGRSELTWEESVRLDLYYTENWSLGGDLLIVLRTVVAVFARRGAY